MTTTDLVTNDRTIAETALFLRALRHDDGPVLREDQCGTCLGTGKAWCARCDGDGTVECTCIDCGDVHDRKCGECNGSGVVGHCAECGGAGSVAHDEPWEGHPADRWTLAALRGMRL